MKAIHFLRQHIENESIFFLSVWNWFPIKLRLYLMIALALFAWFNHQKCLLRNVIHSLIYLWLTDFDFYQKRESLFSHFLVGLVPYSHKIHTRKQTHFNINEDCYERVLIGKWCISTYAAVTYDWIDYEYLRKIWKLKKRKLLIFLSNLCNIVYFYIIFVQYF